MRAPQLSGVERAPLTRFDRVSARKLGTLATMALVAIAIVVVSAQGAYAGASLKAGCPGAPKTSQEPAAAAGPKRSALRARRRARQNGS